MARVSDVIDNLIQGISQQSPATRRPTQSAAELNTRHSAVEGLGKRPPLNLIDALVTDNVVPFAHWINRDRVSQYVVLILDETLKVFDVSDGTEVASFALASGHPLYNAGTDKRSQYVAYTKADTTFIASRSVTVAEDAATHSGRPYEAVINVKSGAFSRDYVVRVNGSEIVSYLTPDGAQASQAVYASTDTIADYLVNGDPGIDIPGTPDDVIGSLDTLVASGYTITRNGSVIVVSHPTTDFTIDVDDGQGGNAMTVIKGSVNKFSDLPRDTPVDGFTIQITGDDQNPYDDYFVKWDATLNSWVECAAPGSVQGLDADTMPYLLQRGAGGVWAFGAATWLTREAGSDVSNEAPPFVGQTITAISFNDNRLGIGAGEDLYWSETGDIYNFYRKTVTQYLPDDPFGVVCSGDEEESVSSVRSVRRYNERILVVSDNLQSVVVSGNEFSAGSVRAVPTTSVAVDPAVPALLLKSDLILPTAHGKWSGISQLFVDALSATADVEDITEHVPKLIPADLHTFTGSKTESMVFSGSYTKPASLFVWTYLLKQRERPLSAFTEWTFDTDAIVSARATGSRLDAILRRGMTLYLLTCDLSQALTDDEQDFVTHLDWRVTEADCTVSYNASLDITTITHPVADLSGIAVVSRGGDEEGIGERGQIEDAGAGYVTVQGDWSSRLFFAGVDYTMSYQFSPLYVRDKETGIARQDGRLQVAHLYLDYDRTGYFQVTVQPEGTRPARTRTFEGRIFDSPFNVTDEVSIAKGRFSVPVMTNGETVTITIINDSHLPSNFVLAEWTGSFTPKARRL